MITPDARDRHAIRSQPTDGDPPRTAWYNPAVPITLSEAESRLLVERHGVAVSPFVTASNADAALARVAADHRLGFPVVAKLCGRGVAHKTERGLVRLGLPDEDSLRSACDELLAAARPDDGPVELLVSSMVSGNRELITGLTHDPRFGLVVMLGLGGVLAEALGDAAFRLVPLDRVDATELIDDLAGQPLLGALRGEPAVDRDALADTVLALARVGTEVPGLVSTDLNPLIVADGRPIAVDALVEVDDPDPALGAVA
ncbi:MAG: acetate--CoA ligase family protein [Acidimicrobiales bacterium]